MRMGSKDAQQKGRERTHESAGLKNGVSAWTYDDPGTEESRGAASNASRPDGGAR